MRLMKRKNNRGINLKRVCPHLDPNFPELIFIHGGYTASVISMREFNKNKIKMIIRPQQDMLFELKTRNYELDEINGCPVFKIICSKERLKFIGQEYNKKILIDGNPVFIKQKGVY